jgi:lysophospholipase L1-like esterase
VKNKKLIFLLLFLAVTSAVFVYENNSGSKPQKPTADKPLYIALGDSVAAGVGLETPSDSSACNRTEESYPNLVATTLGLKLVNLACNGATSRQGIIGSQTVNNLALTPQLDTALAGPKPNLFTLTIGANDIGWTDILSKCVAAACGSPEDVAMVNDKLALLSTDLHNVFEKIKANYKDGVPRLILANYYQVFPAGQQVCAAIPGVDSNEQQWWNSTGTKLNTTIFEAGSGYNFIDFALPSFAGHELCSDNSWVQDLKNKTPFHPNAEGQATIAKAISLKYNQ